MRQILDCLGLTLSDFFARETEPARYFFTRADLIDVGSGGVSLLQVGKSLVGRPLQVLLEIYPPGAESARAPYRADGGEEGGVVVSGAIEATVGDEVRVELDGKAFTGDLPVGATTQGKPTRTITTRSVFMSSGRHVITFVSVSGRVTVRSPRVI